MNTPANEKATPQGGNWTQQGVAVITQAGARYR